MSDTTPASTATTPTCSCAAGAGGERHAAAVDPDIKRRNLTRLRRIEGQVRGLHKMVEDERYCADIMVQISSVQEALRAVSRELLRNHLTHCAARAFQAGDGSADAIVDELVSLVFRHER